MSIASRLLFAILVLGSLLGPLTPPLALAAGLLLSLTLGNPHVGLSARGSKLLLQISVVGLGFGMDLPAVWEAGRIGVGFTVATISGTLVLGWLLGRGLGVERESSMLVSTGTAICGGSAIAAVGAVLESDERAMSVSLGTVFTLNAVALFVFPPLGHVLGLTPEQFGLWSAIAIHDTSSVVGAASHFGEASLAMATTVKLARALWIVPLVVGLAALRGGGARRVRLPWFIFFFLLAAALRTLWPAGESTYDLLQAGARRGLTLTLFLIGAGLTRETLRAAGPRPLLLGGVLWLIVGGVGLVAVRSLLG